MAAADKSSPGKWIWICLAAICVLGVGALFIFPYFATKPKSPDALMHLLPNPPQPTPSPSPAASPTVKKP